MLIVLWHTSCKHKRIQSYLTNFAYFTYEQILKLLFQLLSSLVAKLPTKLDFTLWVSALFPYVVLSSNAVTTNLGIPTLGVDQFYAVCCTQSSLVAKLPTKLDFTLWVSALFPRVAPCLHQKQCSNYQLRQSLFEYHLCCLMLYLSLHDQ